MLIALNIIAGLFILWIAFVVFMLGFKAGQAA